MLFPILVAVIAFWFAGKVLRIYISRKRAYQLIWTVALTLGGLASLFFLLFLATDRNNVYFRLYYVCGGLMMAAYLGLGSVYLLAPRRYAHFATILVAILSIVGTVLIFMAPLRGVDLHANNVEAGTGVIGGPSVAVIVVLNSFGALAVVGGALYSAWNLWRRRGNARLLAANLCIAGGTILASLAGSLARLATDGAYFWIVLAAGFAVLFYGFSLTASRVEGGPSAAARATLP